MSLLPSEVVQPGTMYVSAGKSVLQAICPPGQALASVPGVGGHAARYRCTDSAPLPDASKFKVPRGTVDIGQSMYHPATNTWPASTVTLLCDGAATPTLAGYTTSGDGGAHRNYNVVYCQMPEPAPRG
jgi:hypothetical protein